ncbi:MAG: DUF177 domain-containing protein [Magnetococcales bacterium]|nr:DUF177 domain-containing protein [Magnetococcales bacterium]
MSRHAPHQDQDRDLTGLRLAVAEMGRNPRVLRGHLPPAALVELAQEGRILEPVRVDLTVQRQDRRLVVRGLVTGRLELVCARCLTPFVGASNLQVERFFAIGADPADGAGPARDGTMPDDVVDLEDGFFSVLRFVEEELILALPMAPLCRETCAGLCCDCGVDLNVGPCGCH